MRGFFCCFEAGSARDALRQVFADARCLAFEITQVIQLGATHRTATLDLHRVDARAVGLEDALDAGAVRDLAHGERRVEASIGDRDHDAFDMRFEHIGKLVERGFALPRKPVKLNKAAKIFILIRYAFI